MDITAAARCIRIGASSAAAKAAAEKVLENRSDITHIAAESAKPAKAAASACTPAVARIDAGEAKLVIPLPLLRVGKDFVRLIDLLELFLRLFIAGVQVRMVFFCHLAVGFF